MGVLADCTTTLPPRNSITVEQGATLCFSTVADLAYERSANLHLNGESHLEIVGAVTIPNGITFTPATDGTLPTIAIPSGGKLRIPWNTPFYDYDMTISGTVEAPQLANYSLVTHKLGSAPTSHSKSMGQHLSQ